MTKLNQILAIEKGTKSQNYSEITRLHKVSEKPELFDGFTRVYNPLNTEGEQFPPENKRVQYVASEMLREVERRWTESFDIEMRKEITNTVAKADLVIDGVTILKDAPATYFLYLEKQIDDVKKFVNSLPMLDPAVNWQFDKNLGFFRSDEQITHKSKKTPKVIVKYEATKEHPAQTELVAEDVTIGHWTAVKQSGALQRPEKMALLERIEKLEKAVKISREKANMTDEVVVASVGKAIFNYLMPQTSAA